MSDDRQALLDRIAELEEMVRQLTSERYGDGANIPGEWGLTSSEKLVLGALAKAPRLSKDNIFDALYALRHDDALPDIKIVDVYVCKLRKKVKPYGVEIVTHWGQGYSLDEKSRVILSGGPRP